jgi:DNA-binding MarR family transcriptional regulator
VSHPRRRLLEIVHQPVRFSIMATLAAAQEAEFSFVRDTVEISDSMLSRQASVLEQVGYVYVRKGHVGRRPRTWLSLTKDGRAAFDEHVAALRDLVGSADDAATGRLSAPVRGSAIEARVTADGTDTARAFSSESPRPGVSPRSRR